MHTALFLKLWLERARSKEKNKQPEIFRNPHVNIITSSTPDRLSGFILDLHTYGEHQVGVYLKGACGSTWIGTLRITEDNLIALKTRDEKLFNEQDALRLLRTFMASVEYALVLMTERPVIKLDSSFAGEMSFEAELLMLAKRLINRVEDHVPANASEMEFCFGGPKVVDQRLVDGPRLLMKYDADTWHIAIRNYSTEGPVECSSPVVLFRVLPDGRLGKEPYTSIDRRVILNDLHAWLAKVDQELKPSDLEV